MDSPEERVDFLADSLAAITERDDFFGGAGVLPSTIHPGNGRLVVVTGDNASGKSFVGKWFMALHQNYCNAHNIQADRFNVGMASRTASGMHRVFMYGDEETASTGDVSIKAVIGAFNTSKSRESNHLVVLDEPDTGLSDEYAAALGRYIADFVADQPPLCDALVVVSHSRRLMRELLPLAPHHIRMGDGLTLEQWLTQDVRAKSVDDLLALREASLQRFRAVSKHLRL